MWLLQSYKKILHIVQIDVKSENCVSANSLIPDLIYFWMERELLLPSFVILANNS